MNLPGANCRKGDVAMFKCDCAYVISGDRFVIPRGYFVFITGLDWMETIKRRCWHWRVEPVRIRTVGRTKSGRLIGVNDDVLRPIRPGDGEDEMLRIAGKPEARPVFEFNEEQG